MAGASLISELEETVQRGSPQKRADTLKRITSLFIDGATRFNDDHISLFDDVFGLLIAEIEMKARAELSHRLAPIGNAPIHVLRTLAHDDDIAVAAPVLTKSARLQASDLLDIAKSKSQAHLSAISERREIAEAVADVLVRRGDGEVARKVADNQGARLSESGFTTLVQRAEYDGVLAEKVGSRGDIPSHLFRDLLLRATEVVQKRLLASAKPETQEEIRRVLAKVSKEVAETAPQRDFTAALAATQALKAAGRLGENELVAFAKAEKFEETVASLALLSGIPLAVVDRLMAGERPDPVLILCKATGFGWPTARAAILARLNTKGKASVSLDEALVNFEKLSVPTAQRVVRFWQVRQDTDAA